MKGLNVVKNSIAGIALAMLVALGAPWHQAHAQSTPSWLWWGDKQANSVPVSAANPLPVTPIGGSSGMLTDASNATLPSARTNLGIGSVSPKDYGSIADGSPHPLSTKYATLAAAKAVCPDATSLTQQVDWCAIDAAVAAIKASVANTGAPFAQYLLIPQGNYYLGAVDTVNLSCLSDPTGTDGCGASANNGQFRIIANGAVFTCHTTGLPCVYGLGSRFVQVSGLRIIGDCTDEPTVGLMIGRTTNSIPADYWKTDGIRYNGCFSWAGYYNLASEQFVDIGSVSQNLDSSGGAASFAGILDSGNHWGAPSLYGVTESITTDQNQSFNDPHFYSSSFIMGTGSTGQGLWVYGTRGLKLDGVYINSAGTRCVVIYVDTSGSVQSVPDRFDGEIHCEPSTGATQNSTFFVTGGTSGSHITPILKYFSYHDHFNFASTQIFEHDAFVDTVTMQYADIVVDNVAHAPTVGDGASVWFFYNRAFRVPPAMVTLGTAVMSYGNGYQALSNATTGNSNVALGSNAAKALTTANNITAVGTNALQSSATSGGNTGVGAGAGTLASAGNGTFIGINAGSHVSSGANNTIIGSAVASTTLSTGGNNVLIGTNSSIDTAAGSTSNTIQIGAGSTAVLSVTGAGTPSTSATTIAGSLAIPAIPTSCSGKPTGTLWNNSNVVNVCP